MPSVHINSLKSFVKLLEPVGDMHAIIFGEGGISVWSIDGSNQLIAKIRMPIHGIAEELPNIPQEKIYDEPYKLTVISLDSLKNILPKDSDDVTIRFGKQWSLNAGGYRAVMPTFAMNNCCRTPKKDMDPVPEHAYPVNTQKMYDYVSQLKAVIKDQVGFELKVEPGTPAVTVNQWDSLSGSLSLSLLTRGAITKPLACNYPYDMALPVLNALRLYCEEITLKFIPLPSDETCSAMLIEGKTNDEHHPIEFRYIVAPRLRT